MTDKKQTYKEKNGTTRVGDFLRSIGKGEILEKVTGAIGGLASGNILGAISAVLGNSKELTPEQRDYALKMAELDFREAEEITKRWEADVSSKYWLPSNIRPLTLAFLIFSTIILIIIDSSSSNFKINTGWIDLLMSIDMLVIGSYFGMRSIDKFNNYKNNK